MAVHEPIESLAPAVGIPLPPWEGPPRLWSLADMIEFFFMNFTAVVRYLDEEVRNLAEAADGKPRDPAERVPPSERQRIEGRVLWIQEECHRIGLLKKSFIFSLTLALVKKICSFETLCEQIKQLRGAILNELSAQKFVFVPAARSEYFEQRALFGKAVHRELPLARNDIKEAGNLIAVGADTAAVFHLIRATEHGLRALAMILKVRLSHKGHYHPVEYAVWDKVITGCKNRIEKARKLNPGPKRKMNLEIYSDAADHCLFIKDIWRNDISHTGGQYSPAEARAVMERVRDFMVFLATRPEHPSRRFPGSKKSP